jgi:hypothetical protein
MSVLTALPCILSYPLGVNYSFVRSFVNHGGSISWAQRTISVTASAQDDSIALLESIMPVHVNHQEVMTVSINAKFSPPVVGATQLVGMGDLSRGCFIGFKDEAFGFQMYHDGCCTFWKLRITHACTTSGIITLTLVDRVIQIPVMAGMTPWQIMLYLYQNSAIADANLRVSIECDQLEIYTTCAKTFDTVSVHESIDFGTTGIEGTLICSKAGFAASEAWVPATDFQETCDSILEDISFTSMNVYQFSFSRWSSGGIKIEILNPFNLFMTPIHTFIPGDRLFDTIIPYQPNIRIMKTGVTADPVTIEHSQGVISSGIPSTAGLKTRFTRHFFKEDVHLSVGKQTTIGIIASPIVQTGVRNVMIADVVECRLTAVCSRPFIIHFLVNSVSEGTFVCSRHLPWSAVNTSSNDIDASIVYGGMEVDNILISSSDKEYIRTFDQMWIMPGSILTISAEPLDNAVKLKSIDVSFGWFEN